MKEKELNLYKAKVLAILVGHIGKAKAVSMHELYRQVFEKEISERGLISDTRVLRRLITILRSEGTAVCSSASAYSGGYYLAAAGSELDDYCRRLHSRALRTLVFESKIRKTSLKVLLGQMRLNMIEDGAA